jgi:hypothetical protein
VQNVQAGFVGVSGWLGHAVLQDHFTGWPRVEWAARFTRQEPHV